MSKNTLISRTTNNSYFIKIKDGDSEYRLEIFMDYDPEIHDDIECCLHVYHEDKKLYSIFGTTIEMITEIAKIRIDDSKSHALCGKIVQLQDHIKAWRLLNEKLRNNIKEKDKAIFEQGKAMFEMMKLIPVPEKIEPCTT
jgi:hypothetical protein